jgi:hypothetical protein
MSDSFLRNRYGPKVALLLALTLACGTSAFAVGLGTDITYFDGATGSGAWYGGTADGRVNGGIGVHEDQETEPGTVTTEPWDLEGVYLDSTRILSLVGQYNFGAGQDGYNSGDIFLSVNVGTLAGPPNTDGSDFRYVIDISSTGGTDDSTNPFDGNLDADGIAVNGLTYVVYDITGLVVDTSSPYSGLVGTTFFPASNPYRWVSGGTRVASGTFTLSSGYDANQIDTVVGSGNLLGGSAPHYVLSGFDLSFLGSSVTSLYTHYTMECGNDVLSGYTTSIPPLVPVAEPASLLVLGIGLLGAAAAKRGAKRLTV